MASADRKVVFRRIRGRIVPIRISKKAQNRFKNSALLATNLGVIGAGIGSVLTPTVKTRTASGVNFLRSPKFKRVVGKSALIGAFLGAGIGLLHTKEPKNKPAIANLAVNTGLSLLAFSSVGLGPLRVLGLAAAKTKAISRAARITKASKRVRSTRANVFDVQFGKKTFPRFGKAKKAKIIKVNFKKKTRS